MRATRANAVMGVAHSVFEVVGGVALPAQDIVGLRAATALHGALLGAAWREPRSAGRHRVRALANGVGVAGTVAHFVGWRTEWRGPFPVLVGRAEGLAPAWTRWYTPLLYLWGVASVAAVVQDTAPEDRLWAAAGVASLPGIVAAGHRKERWAREQAGVRPRWWNRALAH